MQRLGHREKSDSVAVVEEMSRLTHSSAVIGDQYLHKTIFMCNYISGSFFSVVAAVWPDISQTFFMHKSLHLANFFCAHIERDSRYCREKKKLYNGGINIMIKVLTCRKG